MADVQRSYFPAPRKRRIQDLTARLDEAEATMRAIYAGEVDAVVVNGPHGPQVYTLEGADHPYRVLVEQMHEGTLTIDPEGVILYSNRQFASMVEAPLESITGSKFTRFLSSGDAAAFGELTEGAAQRGHSSADLTLCDAHRSSIPVRISVTQFDLAGMHAICLVISDLREQRRSEAILQEQQLSRLIFNQSSEAIVVIDPHGMIIRCSDSARNLAGGPVVSRPFDLAFPLLAGGKPLMAASFFSGGPDGCDLHGLEADMVQSGGRRLSLLVSAGPLRSLTSEFLGCVITLIDITHRKRAEEALVRQSEELARANADLRQFAHSASHDLREPLRQLAVFSELLQKRYQGKLDEEAEQLIRHTVDSAHRMEDLLKGLLEYTQAAGAPLDIPHPADPNAVVRKTLETFREQIETTGAAIACEPLPHLLVHEVHLVQLFQNLVGNALKYRSQAAPLIRISAERMEPFWGIAVSDNGIGIAPDYQQQVFGLFQRLHGGGRYSGSGMGLAICEKIVQRYGGRIWVESEPGQGSKFVFTLPGDGE